MWARRPVISSTRASVRRCSPVRKNPCQIGSLPGRGALLSGSSGSCPVPGGPALGGFSCSASWAGSACRAPQFGSCFPRRASSARRAVGNARSLSTVSDGTPTPAMGPDPQSGSPVSSGSLILPSRLVWRLPGENKLSGGVTFFPGSRDFTGWALHRGPGLVSRRCRSL